MTEASPLIPRIRGLTARDEGTLPFVAATVACLLIVSACTGDEGKPSPTASSSPTVATTSRVEPSPTTAPPLPPATTTPPAPTTTTTIAEPLAPAELAIAAFPVPGGSRPHDVAPAADGGVWYTAQGSGELGWLDPVGGETRHVALGPGSRPHGVIVGQDGAPWITDSGLNAIVQVDPQTEQVTVYPLPDDRSDANLNTAVFDPDGRLWFTGQNGIYGVLDPSSGSMDVFDAPRGRGPYGITVTPTGSVYYASLAGSYVGQIEADDSATVLEPPTPDQGSRRVWSDSQGAIWVSEWNAGQLSRYRPSTGEWTTWPLPGDGPQAYAVYVDDTDIVWISDFGGNAIHRFDPRTEGFDTFSLPHNPGNVRQILGRTGEVWGAESAADQLVVIWRG